MKLKICQHVMFLFYRLLHAAPGKGDDDDEEESSTVEQELINCLAEVYQTSQGTENKRGKKRMKANLSFFFFFSMLITTFCILVCQCLDNWK